jgi:hypothetical protein
MEADCRLRLQIIFGAQIPFRPTCGLGPENDIAIPLK